MYVYQLMSDGTAMDLPPMKEPAVVRYGQLLIVGGWLGKLTYRTTPNTGNWPDYKVPQPRYDRAVAMTAEGKALVASLKAKPQTIDGRDAVAPAKPIEGTKSRAENIQDCEDAVENGLAVLEKISLSSVEVTKALPFLAPKGFRPVVEFHGAGGRKIRRTTSADKWDPETCEILITFEPAEAGVTDAVVSVQPAKTMKADGDMEEVCRALAEAEIGRSFVALKWFRDELLPAKGYAWATALEDRHAVLTRAITGGWILTGKVTNPRAPQHPTTTVRVNRQRQSHFPGGEARRFRPVPIHGEPLSQTILRDRGER
jgi:hypothetical protein